MELVCGKCKQSKLTSEFHRNSKRPSGFNSYCKLCVKDYHRQYREKNPEEYRRKNRDANRRFYETDIGKESSRKKTAKRYGLSLSEYDEILSRNGGLCQICNEKPSVCLDHCHKTLIPRGGLCSECNKGLGLFYDRPELLRGAIEYLAGVSPLADNE